MVSYKFEEKRKEKSSAFGCSEFGTFINHSDQKKRSTYITFTLQFVERVLVTGCGSSRNERTKIYFYADILSMRLYVYIYE